MTTGNLQAYSAVGNVAGAIRASATMASATFRMIASIPVCG